MKMWGGRFDGEPDAGFMQFSSSISFDVRLYPYDIECTRAWAEALVGAGVLSADESLNISGALDSVKEEFDSGAFTLSPDDEDIHTAIERRLVELIGSEAGKVRTGRSRNDQVATDTRMFVMDQCARLAAGMRLLQTALIDKAADSIDIVVPGHTHLQQAQPVLLAHALLAFVQMLERDAALLNGASKAADSLPLGSGALAGTTLDVDREALADRLGFSGVSANSLDAVGDRDFACDLVYALAMVMVHLSRLSEQVILWASAEWGIAELGDAWSTGSSLMPQKKNPDSAELVRGKTGRLLGDLLALLTTLKGLPLSYNRDLQEDKEPLFDAVDTASASLDVMGQTVATLTFDRERAASLAAGGFMTATDLADYLAEKGLQFPEAHGIVGRIVTYCIAQGKGLGDLSAEEMLEFSELLGPDALEWTGAEASAGRRVCTGGTAPEAVARQIALAREMIAGA